MKIYPMHQSLDCNSLKKRNDEKFDQQLKVGSL